VDTYAPRSENCWVDVDNGSLTLNRTRGLLAEFGVVIARSADRFLGASPKLIGNARLPDPVHCMLLEVSEQLVALNLRLARCDQQIATHARNSNVTKRAGELLGVGPETSSALAAMVPDAKIQERAAVRRLAGPDAATAQLRRQDAAWTYQFARQCLPAHAARQGRPKYVAVGTACGPHARRPATTVDQTAPRTQGISQDADCDCQQAYLDVVGDACKKRTLRCRRVATPSGTSAVTTRYSMTRLA
jgi:hypothetical protein